MYNIAFIESFSLGPFTGIISVSGDFLHATLRRWMASNASDRESDALWERTLSARSGLFLSPPPFFCQLFPSEDVTFDLLWIEFNSGSTLLDAKSAVLRLCKAEEEKFATKKDLTLSSGEG